LFGLWIIFPLNVYVSEHATGKQNPLSSEKNQKVLSRISRRRRRSGQEALACLAELAPCLAELAPCLVGLAASLSGWIGSSSGRIGVHRCSAHSAQQSLELIAWSNLPPNSFPAPPLRASAFRLRS
jgi:hypothetical protein